ALVWEDGRTRNTLRLPYANGQSLELIAEDVTGTDPARRAADAAAFDRQERQARLAAGAPLTRLPPYLDYEGVRLGSSRAHVLQALPRGESVVKRDVPGGMMVSLNGEAPKGAPYTPRQAFIRFDGEGKVVGLRTRYGEGAAGGNWTAAVLSG